MKKIIIIKLGAQGDVLRTLPVAIALKKKYPSSKLTWVTKSESLELLTVLPYLDEVHQIPFESKEEYDLAYNLDVEEEASNILSKIKAKEKFGFFLDSGYPSALNPGANYYLNTMFDDDLKRTNTKTYQEMIFEAANLTYHHERATLYLSKDSKDYAKNFFVKHSLVRKKVIGIHMGASSRWPSKVWAKENLLEFIGLASNNGFHIILFGGPNEGEAHSLLSKEIKSKKLNVVFNDPKNSKLEFASLVSRCSILVCSDSFSLHVALGLGVKSIALFFCTSPAEVEGYDLLTKLVSPKLNEFFPHKSDVLDLTLTQSISANEVLEAVISEIQTNKKQIKQE